VIGDLETSHAFCSLLARIARCAGAVGRLPLAPEHRFPAGLEDVLAAYRWAATTPRASGARRAAIGGDSMGGNFAAVVCQELKRAGEPQPACSCWSIPASTWPRRRPR
jgi:acetyl esterase/lipase